MQTACFAAGIWLQHFCITWTAREAVWRQSILGLDELASQVVRDLPGEIEKPISSAALESIARPLLGKQSGLGLMLLDKDWRVRSSAAVDGLSAVDLRHRLPNWEVRKAEPQFPITGKLAVFTIQDEQHLGVLHDARKHGFLVAHRSQAAIEEQLSALLSGLTGVSITTLIWTMALMGICVYMAAGKFCNEVDRERSKANIETLRQRQNLIRTRDAVIFGLARLTESRDPETGNHLDRISMYATTLASALMNHPDFKDMVTPSFVKLIGISAALHDIGKVGVEDRILLKPAKLTPAERAMMEDHCRIGGECLMEIERRLGRSNFLHMARDIAFAHHEHWDGSGYPHGLRGEEIPLAARIVSIADVYDALASRRVYKEPQPHDECVAAIRAGSGTQFDPRLIEIWLTLAPRFREISEKFGASKTPMFDGGRKSAGENRPERDFYRTVQSSGATPL